MLNLNISYDESEMVTRRAKNNDETNINAYASFAYRWRKENHNIIDFDYS